MVAIFSYLYIDNMVKLCCGSLSPCFVLMCTAFLHDIADPYVKIITLHQGSRLSKWKTTVKKNTLTPVFNELCLLDISRVDIQDLQIDVMVMDYDRFGRNNQIGSIIFGHDVANKTARNHWNEAINNPNTSCMFWHAIGRLDTSKLRPRSRSRSPSPRRSSRIKSSASDS